MTFFDCLKLLCSLYLSFLFSMVIMYHLFVVTLVSESASGCGVWRSVCVYVYIFCFFCWWNTVAITECSDEYELLNIVYVALCVIVVFWEGTLCSLVCFLSPCLFDAERRGEVQMWTKKKTRWSALRGFTNGLKTGKSNDIAFVCNISVLLFGVLISISPRNPPTTFLSPFILSLSLLPLYLSLCLFCQFWWATSCAAGSCRECPVDSIVLRRIDSIHFRPGTCCDSDCLVLWITPLFAKSNLVYPMPVQPALALFQCLISMRHSPVSIDFILSFIADSILSLFSWSMMSTKPKHRYVLIAWMSRVRF